MMRAAFVSFAAAVFLVAASDPAQPTSFPPLTATGYQNASDGIDYTSCSQFVNTQDETDAVRHLDDVWAPHAEGCVVFPYFATGTSTHFLDALSLHFDLGSPVSPPDAVLRAFVRKGAYEDICGSCYNWHNYRLYPGAFNEQDGDCDWSCAGVDPVFPADRSWSGWIEMPVSPDWFDSGRLDVSLRFWNAQVDAVELDVDASTPTHGLSWGQVKLRYR